MTELSHFRKWYCGSAEVTGDDNTARLSWNAALIEIVAQSMRCAHTTQQVTPEGSEYFVTISQIERMAKNITELAHFCKISGQHEDSPCHHASCQD